MKDLKGQEPVHIPVMVEEVLQFLNPEMGGLFVDATAGLGGHSKAILEKLGKNGLLLAIEKDPKSFEFLVKRLSSDKRVLTVRTDYTQLCEVIENFGLPRPSGVLFDLGISSFHIEHSGRGFSYRKDEILDMRFDPESGEPAWKAINALDARKLSRILENFGELKQAMRISNAIVEYRRIHGKIMRTSQLNEAVGMVIPKRKLADVLPKVYQAFRIFVNRELEHVVEGLAHALACLAVGGRLVVISYHSLEDRIAKGIKNVHGIERLTKKPLRPSEDEVRKNRRARSAKLRAYRKMEDVNEADIYGCIAGFVPSFAPRN